MSLPSITMRAARLHRVGGPLTIDEVPTPQPRSTDVLVKVEACNVVPNLRNVITYYAEWFPYLPLPKLPAIYGLDATGIVAEVGSHVRGIEVGERVYVNPGRSCGGCSACRRGEATLCESYTFQGYFGFGPGSAKIFEDYPYGGLADYLTAPASSLVRLAPSISFEAGARFGYLGTAYAALRKADAGSGASVIITGATGTLGVPAVLLALGMGVGKIFAVARNPVLLARVQALDPRRIEVLSYGERPLVEWVREQTRGIGADILIEAMSTGAAANVTMDGLHALRRGGTGVCIGGMSETLPLNPIWFMTRGLRWWGSVWFSPAEGEDMAAMADAGVLDLSKFEHRRFALVDANRALNSFDGKLGGFANVVVMPELQAAAAAQP
jgi:threonine dehydrogenase-like Zn-dependent dehydrogenase